MSHSLDNNKNQQGFALVTAIMMLFAATIMGLMVMNSSDIEVLLSGAQLRYENDFNTTEGAASFEATAAGRSATIVRGTDTRSYAVVNPSIQNQVLSPSSSLEDIFDPGNDMDISESYTVTTTSDASLWPTDNLLGSSDNSDDQFDYQYRTTFVGAGTTIPKGYSADKFTNYQFKIAAHRNTTIEMGGNKIGPKISL
jgi:hypothetical protein